MPKVQTVTHIRELLRFLNTDNSIAIHKLIRAGIRTTTPAKLITENKTNNTVRTHKTIDKIFDTRLPPLYIILSGVLHSMIQRACCVALLPVPAIRLSTGIG